MALLFMDYFNGNLEKKHKFQNLSQLFIYLSLALILQSCDSGEYSVKLKYRDITSGRLLPYSVPQHIDFFPVDSFGVKFRLPKVNSTAPFVGQIQLGNTDKPVYLLLDKSESTSLYYNLLYLDLNKNHNFADDGPPYSTKGQFILSRNRHYVEFDQVAIPYEWQINANSSEEPFLAKIYFWYPDHGPPASGRIVRECWREGQFKMNQDSVYLILSDDDCNGIYDSNDRWALFPKDSLGEKFITSLRLFRNFTRLGWIGDAPFELQWVSPRGDEVKLHAKQIEWTREEDFARDNPYAHEPRRPKAAHEIHWITNYKQALQIARRSKKPILLDFYTTWSGPYKVMQERTYTDAEVVSLADNFVCVSIDGDQHRNLVKQFNINSYPSTLLLNKRGKEVTRAIGYQPATEFAAFLRSGLKK